MKLISVDTFRAAARQDKPSSDAVFRVSAVEPKAVGEGTRKFRFCFSDQSVDRMGDRIMADGWDVNQFAKNPVALFAHDSSAPPIGRASNVLVEDTRLMGDIEFMSADIYPFAETIFRMVQEKYLNAVSVGFLPRDYKWADEDDDGREWGIDFIQQELVEISIVPVPANANALIDARAKGIDTRPLVEWAEKALDGGGKVIIPRAELERLRKAAKEPAVASARTRRVRRDDTPMSETDPAGGGATVGNCGRPVGEECGMKDVAECSIHGQGEVGVGDEDAEKRLKALVQREIAAAIKATVGPAVTAAVTAALKSAPKPRRRADGDDGAGGGGTEEGDSRPDLSEDHEKCIRMAHMHMKAMGDALDIASDHYDTAMDHLQSVKDALDATPPDDDGLAAGEDPEDKAAKLKRLAAIRARNKV
jgi:HK97 family phage prohead protease